MSRSFRVCKFALSQGVFKVGDCQPFKKGKCPVDGACSKIENTRHPHRGDNAQSSERDIERLSLLHYKWMLEEMTKGEKS